MGCEEVYTLDDGRRICATPRTSCVSNTGYTDQVFGTPIPNDLLDSVKPWFGGYWGNYGTSRTTILTTISHEALMAFVVGVFNSFPDQNIFVSILTGPVGGKDMHALFFQGLLPGYDSMDYETVVNIVGSKIMQNSNWTAGVCP